MAETFTMKLAGLSVRVECRDPWVREFCDAYVCPDPVPEPDFCVGTTEEQVRAQCAEAQTMGGSIETAYAESLCLYREIAERLPYYDRFVFHGACIALDGKGYLFTAPSGTGKSTHILLWRQYFGNRVRIVNGDKPILHLLPDGSAEVCSTPWAGKERWQRNRTVPLAGLCVLERGTFNRTEPLDVLSHPELLVRQTYLPQDARAAGRTLELLGRLGAAGGVRFCRLWCDMSEEAVRVSWEGLTGKKLTQDAVSGQETNGEKESGDED